MSTSIRSISGESRIRRFATSFPLVIGLTSCTVEFTMQVNSASFTSRLLDWGFFFFEWTGSQLRCRWTSSSDINVSATNSQAAFDLLCDGNVHHIACVLGPDYQAIFIDRNLIGSRTGGAGTGLVDTTNKNIQSQGGSVNYQDIYIHNTALSQEQIINILQGTQTRDNIIYYWPFNNPTEGAVAVGDAGLNGDPGPAWNNLVEPLEWTPRLTLPVPPTVAVSRATLLRDGRHLYVGPITIDGEPVSNLDVDKTKITATINGAPVNVLDAYPSIPGVILILLESVATELQEVVLTLGNLSIIGGGGFLTETVITAVNRAGQRMRGPVDGEMFSWNSSWNRYWTKLPILADWSKLSEHNWTSATVNSDGNLISMSGSSTERYMLLGSGVSLAAETVRLSWESESDACALTPLSTTGISSAGPIITVTGNRKYRDYTVTLQPNYVDNPGLRVVVSEVPFESSTIRVFRASEADPSNPDRTLNTVSSLFRAAFGPAKCLRDMRLTENDRNCVRTWAEMNRTQVVSYSADQRGELGVTHGSVTAYENGSNTGMQHSGDWKTVRATCVNHGLQTGDVINFSSGLTVNIEGGTTNALAFFPGYAVRVIDVDTFAFQLFNLNPIATTTDVSLGWRRKVSQMPYSVIVDICNDLGCDYWMCASVTWEPDAVQTLAQYVAENLNGKLYLESPNEAWNGGQFMPSHQLSMLSHDLGIGNTSLLIQQMKYNWETFEAAFVAAGRGQDFFRILGGRAVSDSYNTSLYNVMESRDTFCDYFAPAGYYGSEPAGNSGLPLTGEEIADAGSTCVRAFVSTERLAQSRLNVLTGISCGPNQRVRRGIAVYEWGPAEFNILAHRHPFMIDSIFQAYEAWYDVARAKNCEVGPIAYYYIAGSDDLPWGAMQYESQGFSNPPALDADLSDWRSIPSSKMWACHELMKYRWQDIPGATSPTLTIPNSGTTFGDDHLRAFRNKITSGSQVEYTNQVDLIVDPAS